MIIPATQTALLPAESDDTARRFSSWQTQTLIATMLGDAAYCLLRRNLWKHSSRPYGITFVKVIRSSN